MFLFPVILALGDIWVHVCTTNGRIIAPNIKTSINKMFNITTTLDMSNQIIVISNLDDALITQGFEASETLLKMWLFFNMDSTTLKLMGILVFSIKYGISMIFRYELD